jgi:hypothetical protein
LILSSSSTTWPPAASMPGACSGSRAGTPTARSTPTCAVSGSPWRPEPGEEGGSLVVLISTWWRLAGGPRRSLRRRPAVRSRCRITPGLSRKGSTASRWTPSSTCQTNLAGQPRGDAGWPGAGRRQAEGGRTRAGREAAGVAGGDGRACEDGNVMQKASRAFVFRSRCVVVAVVGARWCSTSDLSLPPARRPGSVLAAEAGPPSRTGPPASRSPPSRAAQWARLTARGSGPRAGGASTRAARGARRRGGPNPRLRVHPHALDVPMPRGSRPCGPA